MTCKPSPTHAEWVFVAIADGMGGLADGDIASHLAVEAFTTSLFEGDTPQPSRLAEGFSAASSSIRRYAQSHPSSRRMGSTLIGCVVRDGRAFLGNIGDCRAYLLRNGSIRCLTTDHTLVAEYVSLGVLSADEAAASPYGHILTRFLGSEHDVGPADIFPPLALQDGDSLIISSDGLHSFLLDEELLNLADDFEPNDAVRNLIDAVMSRGAPDDVTFAVASVWDAGDEV